MSLLLLVAAPVIQMVPDEAPKPDYAVNCDAATVDGGRLSLAASVAGQGQSRTMRVISRGDDRAFPGRFQGRSIAIRTRHPDGSFSLMDQAVQKFGEHRYRVSLNVEGVGERGSRVAVVRDLVAPGDNPTYVALGFCRSSEGQGIRK